MADQERLEYAVIPYRRWTRCFRSEGVRVIHGPVSSTRTGNYAPRAFIDGLKEFRCGSGFRALDFRLQVKIVVWWVTRQPKKSA